MKPFIDPPKHIPWYLRIALWISKLKTGKDMIPGRVLAWFPRSAIGSGILEALTPHARDMDGRLLKLVRLQSSFVAACPFCIDMNSFEADLFSISTDEIDAMMGKLDILSIKTFNDREIAALQYAKQISSSPLSFPGDLIDQIKFRFTEREIVILAATCAQVNYWARLIQALGIPPAGFSESCPLTQ